MAYYFLRADKESYDDHLLDEITWRHIPCKAAGVEGLT